MEKKKLKAGDIIQLEDGTIVRCRKTNLNRNYSCDICYFRNEGYNCNRFCPEISLYHFEEVKVIKVTDFKPIEQNEKKN